MSARQQGFTLIEVLVALAIVTIGMAAVMGAITSSASTITYLHDKTFAAWVAENQIATLRLQGSLVQAGDTNGDTDYAGTKWHWRMEVAATEIPGVMRIDINVRPAEVKGNDDGPWYTTVTGIQGDAVGVPNGYQPDWGAQQLPGQATSGVMGSGSGAMGSMGNNGTNFGTQGSSDSSSSGLGGTTLGSPSSGGPSGGLGGNGSSLGSPPDSGLSGPGPSSPPDLPPGESPQ